tara:strand:+ start:904 stop:1272 length:369 start_codon:yes stop_codon:yes gene_type:complete
MDAELAASLTEYGVLGMWTLSLLWRDVSLSKKMQAQQEAFHVQLAEIEQRADEKEHLLRDRYDEVIREYAEQREKLMIDIVAKLDRMQDDLGATLTKVEEGLAAMRERYAEERAIRRMKQDQ